MLPWSLPDTTNAVICIDSDSDDSADSSMSAMKRKKLKSSKEILKGAECVKLDER